MKNPSYLIFLTSFFPISACATSENYVVQSTKNVPVRTVVDAWNNREYLHHKFVRISGFLYPRGKNYVLFSTEDEIVRFNCVQSEEPETRGMLVFFNGKKSIKKSYELPKKVTIAGFFVNEAGEKETLIINKTLIENDKPCNGPLIDATIVQSR